MMSNHKERWAKMLSEYLLQIEDDSGMNRDDLLSKLKAKLGSDDGVTCITIGITDDYAFEANLFKDDGGEDRVMHCNFGDIQIVNRIIEDSQEDVSHS